MATKPTFLHVWTIWCTIRILMLTLVKFGIKWCLLWKTEVWFCIVSVFLCFTRHLQRWSRGHKARGQGLGQGLGQGHKKKFEAKAKDSLSEDRHSRGQGQECSRPRPRIKDTSASALQKKKKSSQKFFRRSPKKRSSQEFFQAISTKKRFPKNFSRAPQNFNNSKNSAVLEPRTGQFSRAWGLEAKAED